MDETKKRILTIVLTIYLTIVTIGCALFGFLYFGSLKRSGVSLKLNAESAKVLVNTACYDLGLISRADYDKAVGNKTEDVSSSAITYKEYKESEADYQTILKTLNMDILVDMSMFLAKSAFDEELKPNTYYVSTQDKITYDYFAMYFNMKDNKLTFHFFPITEQELYCGQDIILEKTEGGWNLEYKALITTSSDGGEVMLFYNLKLEKDSAGVSYAKATVSGLYTESQIGEDDPKIKQVDYSKIYPSCYYECDVKKQERAFMAGEDSEISGTDRKLTTEENKAVFDEAVKNTNDLDRGTYLKYKDKKLVENDYYYNLTQTDFYQRFQEEFESRV